MIGAAPAPLEVFEFFAAIGIPICEVWGMSELSSSPRWCRPTRLASGPWASRCPGVEIRLAEDGEVLVRGEIVMAGYRNQPEKTAETIDADGWLHTGDIGEFDDDGYLKIIDRKKELIINAAGKNMSPANIEQQLKTGSPLIGQAIAIGDGRPYNVALIVLDPDASRGVRPAARACADASPAALADEPRVLEEVSAGVARANSPPLPRRADQALPRPPVRLAAGRRRADADDEAQAQADRGEVRGRDRGAVRRALTPLRAGDALLIFAAHVVPPRPSTSSPPPSGGIARRRPHVAANQHREEAKFETEGN